MRADQVIGFAVKSFSALGVTTGQQLRAMVAASPNPRETVLRRLLSFLPDVVSLEPYWQTRAAELRSLVDQLPRPPTFYFTVTVDCLAWADLYAYIGGRELADYDMARELPTVEDRLWELHLHPRPASAFLARKLDAFVEDFVVPHLEVVDRYWRAEWQEGTGNLHLHGLLWSEDAPRTLDDGRPLILLPPEAQAQIVR